MTMAPSVESSAMTTSLIRKPSVLTFICILPRFGSCCGSSSRFRFLFVPVGSVWPFVSPFVAEAGTTLDLRAMWSLPGT